MNSEVQTDIAEHSREVIRKGSKSFAAAARLFDSATRDNVYMLYAWCRYCDDEIDGQELGFAKAEPETRTIQQRLELILGLTERALAGETMAEPPFQGLQRIVAEYSIPHRYPLELIEGFAMDAQGRRYFTLEETLLYCYHVAGVVGVMMAYVMGVREPAALKRAADLGIAFQLTNIVRDIIDDAENGRCYLPEELLKRFDVPVDEVQKPEHRQGVFRVANLLLDEADRYYESAVEGIRMLPSRSAWAICTASGVYRDIGEIVRNQGESAWQQRAIVSKTRKLYWVLAGGLRALAATSFDRGRQSAPRAPDLWAKSDIC